MNKPVRLLVVMDPIDRIKYQKDTCLLYTSDAADE